MTWSTDTYFTKAQRYWSRASGKERGSGEALLDIAFACEFIIRGALCHLNPALNAAGDDDSILFATGLDPKKPPKTIDITVGLRRLSAVVPQITESEIATITAIFDARNRELHGDEDAISNVVKENIMPQLYSAIVKVTLFADQDLSSLLGEGDAEQARRSSEAIQKDRKRRVKSLIDVCKERFFGLTKADQQVRREETTPKFQSAVMKSGHHVKAMRCPSCSNNGLLAGVPVGRSSPILRDDGIFFETRISPSLFECKCCELKIKGLDEIMAAGFGHEFQSIDEVDIIEHFGIDPMDYVDTDEIIRDYQSDMYEYQDE